MAANFALILSQKASSGDAKKNAESLLGDIKAVIAQQKKNFSYGRTTEKIIGWGFLAKFVSDVEEKRKDRLSKKTKNSSGGAKSAGVGGIDDGGGMGLGQLNNNIESILSEMYKINSRLRKAHKTIFKMALNVSDLTNIFKTLMKKSGLEELKDRENLLEGSRKKKVENLAAAGGADKEKSKSSILGLLGSILAGGLLTFAKDIQKFAMSLVKTLSKFTGKIKKFPVTLSTTFSKVTTYIADVIKSVQTRFVKFISRVTQFAKVSIEIFGKFTAGFAKIGGIFKIVTKLLGKLFVPLLVVMTIFDTVKATIEGYKEGGIVGAIKGAITGFFSSLVTVPLDLIKDLIAWTVGKLGFKEGEELLNSFSFTGLFTSLVDGIFGFLTGAVDWIKNQFGFTGEGMPDFKTLILGMLTFPINLLITTITGLTNLVTDHFDSIMDIGKGFMAMFGIKPKEETLNPDMNVAREDVRTRALSDGEKSERKKNIVKLLTDQNEKRPKNERMTPQEIDTEASRRVQAFSSSLSSDVQSPIPTINNMMTENARMSSIAKNDRINPSITVTAPSVTSVDARSSNNAFLQPVERNQDRTMNDIRGGWG